MLNCWMFLCLEALLLTSDMQGRSEGRPQGRPQESHHHDLWIRVELVLVRTFSMEGGERRRSTGTDRRCLSDRYK